MSVNTFGFGLIPEDIFGMIFGHKILATNTINNNLIKNMIVNICR